ncbi:hypothetical protein B1B05_00340 [Domibacillus enclensis]|uniref:Uncharacterized protein n=1 Tax=Domibacillus enclensis TaxID=1017273 RepID=A0ABX4EC05_9BACI|nr:hypothetical protein B1B05_00340 [Domibacillus enclensis]
MSPCFILLKNYFVNQNPVTTPLFKANVLARTQFGRLLQDCAFGGAGGEAPVGRADRLKQPRFLGWFSVRPTGKRSRQPGALECSFLEK